MATTPLKYLNQYFTTTLNVGGGIDASQTTGIIVSDVSGVDTAKPGVALINYADPLNTSIAEWITYTSINGSKEFVGVTRGAEGFSAKTHDNSVAVAFPLSRSNINNLNAMFDSTGLDIKQIATPANPDSGRNKLYFKSDESLYKLTSAGTETAIGTSMATDTLWDAAGDLAQGTGANTAAKLPIGSAGDVLRVVSGVAAWTGTNFKAVSLTRDLTASSGNVSTTGVGFTPKSALFLAVKSATTLASVGITDGTASYDIQIYGSNLLSYSTTKCISITDGSASQEASLATFDSDGFTLTWTKTGSPTGTANFFGLLFR